MLMEWGGVFFFQTINWLWIRTWCCLCVTQEWLRKEHIVSRKTYCKLAGQQSATEANQRLFYVYIQQTRLGQMLRNWPCIDTQIRELTWNHMCLQGSNERSGGEKWKFPSCLENSLLLQQTTHLCKHCLALFRRWNRKPNQVWWSSRVIDATSLQVRKGLRLQATIWKKPFTQEGLLVFCFQLFPQRFCFGAWSR